MSAPPVSSLFRYIESLHGNAPWGRFLDAGTGVNSALWSTSLPVTQWVAVTGAQAHADQVRRAVGDRLRPDDQLIVSNWTDESLLRGEVFDTVLADYLIGAVEGFAPYFQSRMFRRLAPLVGRHLYIVGLEPYVTGQAQSESGQIVQAIGRLRDACLLHAGETPYREYPAQWMAEAVTAAGFRVVTARHFPNRYKEKWINSQLNMALRRLPLMADQGLAEALRGRIESLREKALRLCETEGGLRYGADYVMSCVPDSKGAL